MSTLESHSRDLIESVTNDGKLSVQYDKYLQWLLSEPPWSGDEPSGSRIPWRLAAEAAKCRALADAFNSPGIYLFGSSDGVPLYLGMTRRPLWTRLSRRYVRGTRSQCQLAVDYERELIARGLDGFPEDVRAWYRQLYKNSTARLRGAVLFARCGIEGIWFTLIPVSDSEAVRDLERTLIPIADAWNRSHAHPPLVNVQDN